MPLLDVPRVKQQKTNWCWAACCESFTAFYKKKIKTQHEFLLLVHTDEYQEGFARHAHGGTDRDLNSTAQPTEYAPLLKEILGAELVTHSYVGNHANQRYGKDVVKKAVDDGRIFILGAAGHAKVLCGYGNKPRGEEEGLFFMDPAVGDYTWETWDTYTTKSTTMVWLKKGGLV